MSEGGDTPEKPEESFVDLTALDFGPSWARGPAKGKPGEGKGDATPREPREHGGKGDRREKRGGGHDRRGGGREDRRGGGQRGRQEGN
ncbi:MAG: hypothetical protein HKO57_09250, partial [Akkermansiaceae bacterium]|nr:hypothetical protein [Akkermansiaceae bacterium]